MSVVTPVECMFCVVADCMCIPSGRMVECGSLVVLNTPVECVSSPRPRWAHCCGSVARWSAHTPSTLSWSQERSSVSSVRLQCLMSNSSSSSLRLVWFLPKPTIILLTLFSTLAVTPPLHLTSHLPHFPHSITPSPLLLLFSLLSLLVPNAFHTQLLPPPPMFLPSLPFHPTYFPPPPPPPPPPSPPANSLQEPQL